MTPEAQAVKKAVDREILAAMDDGRAEFSTTHEMIGYLASLLVDDDWEEIRRCAGALTSKRFPGGFSRLPILGCEGAYIQYPKPLTQRDCDVIQAAVQYLRVLVESPGEEL